MTAPLTVALASLKSLLSTDDFTLLSKYRARRKYVLGLRSTNIDGIGVGVSEGYFVMLKLSLSFSAIEMLASVTSRKGNLGIRNEAFVSALNSGAFDKLLLAIDQDGDRRYPHSSSQEIKRWKNLPIDADLTNFVSQCRNYMFHGPFTPSEAGLASSARLRSLVLDLSITTLNAGEVALEKWVNKKRRSRQ